MDILATLDELRMTFHECQAIAYADIGAQIILATSTDEDLPQERWDDLCDTGIALLTGEPAQDARRAMIDGETISHALVLEAHELGLFLRSQTNPDDVIFSVSKPSLPINDFIERASLVLHKIAQDV